MRIYIFELATFRRNIWYCFSIETLIALTKYEFVVVLNCYCSISIVYC